jgi:hypothetical protein
MDSQSELGAKTGKQEESEYLKNKTRKHEIIAHR